MKAKLLWSPHSEKTNLNKFQEKNLKLIKSNNYDSLHRWSVSKKDEFWSSVWDFAEIKGLKKQPIVKFEEDFIKTKFFKNCKLNFVENLIQKNNDDDAIVFYSEKKISRRVSWKQLNINTNKISNYFKNIGIELKYRN